MSEPATAPDESRWVFLRDVVVFQLKLVLDGLRDAVMIPISIAAAVIDLLVPGPESKGLFYRVVMLGRRSESYIHLFEAAERLEPGHELDGTSDPGVDELFRRVEGFLVQQESRGGLTAAARARVDRLLDAIATTRHKH